MPARADGGTAVRHSGRRAARDAVRGQPAWVLDVDGEVEQRRDDVRRRLAAAGRGAGGSDGCRVISGSVRSRLVCEAVMAVE